jgi:general secretion pathway protein G
MVKQMKPRNHRGRNQKGLTLVELIVAFTILAVLSVLALPLASLKIRTEHQGFFGPPKIGSYCYPESLDVLVEGMKLAQDPNGTKLKFLRRIPRDPFTNKFEWGMRSPQDDPTSKSWGGQSVFEVFTKSEEKAPDGTPYSEW